MHEVHPSSAARRFHPGWRELWTHRIRWVTGATAAGALGVTGLLMGVAAHETPAHHTTTSGNTSGGTSTTSGGTSSGATGGTAQGASGGTGSVTTSRRTTTGSGTTSGPIVSPGSGTPHVSTGQS